MSTIPTKKPKFTLQDSDSAVVGPHHITVPAEKLLHKQRTLCCDTALQEHAVCVALSCDATTSSSLSFLNCSTLGNSPALAFKKLPSSPSLLSFPPAIFLPLSHNNNNLQTDCWIVFIYQIIRWNTTVYHTGQYKSSWINWPLTLILFIKFPGAKIHADIEHLQAFAENRHQYHLQSTIIPAVTLTTSYPCAALSVFHDTARCPQIVICH